MRRFVRVLRRHASAAADLVWTPDCPRCGRRAVHPREHFCEACWSGLRALRPSDARWEMSAEDGAPPITACSAFAVDAGFIEMLGASKYRYFRDVGRRLAREAAEIVAPHLVPGVLVPVPLRPERRRQRGFNQTEDFAAALANVTGRTCAPAWLKRQRGGRPLAGLERAQREAAVRNAFRANAGDAGSEVREPVVIVDDVLTTGSTARACASALCTAGWTTIGVVTMGRAFASKEDQPVLDLSSWARF